ncbi:MAG TPA: hypothetical protein VHA06_08795 [Candidatus Angelobacter sp.]|jgi:hypothetical protein|nr:hypothetical protein [Candidatus Angelobacter sp.]
MKSQRKFTSILSTMLIAGMSLGQSLQAQQSNPQPSSTQQTQTPAQPTTTAPATAQPVPATDPSAAPATSNQNSAQQPGSNVNPSQGPLKPVTTYPDAAGEQQAQPQSTPQNLPDGPQPKKPTEPVGAATAESVPTSGGAAAKPAGVAIAPAKQHQTRSLLLKVGAVVAGGAALGIVYALSRGTSSTPPGATLAGVTQK